MTKEDFDAEIQNLAMSLEDEFGQDEDTVATICELLHVGPARVLEALVPDTIGG